MGDKAAQLAGFLLVGQDLRKLRVSSKVDSPTKRQLERLRVRSGEGDDGPPPPSPRDGGVISLTTYAEAAAEYANVVRGRGDGDGSGVIVLPQSEIARARSGTRSAPGLAHGAYAFACAWVYES